MKRKSTQQQASTSNNIKQSRTLFPFAGITNAQQVEEPHLTPQPSSPTPTSLTCVASTRPTHSCEFGTLGATYSVPLSSLPPTWRDENEWYKSLTLTPVVSSCCPVKPPPFKTAFTVGTHLHVPRFIGYTYFGTPATDTRSLGETMNPALSFNGTLCDTTPPQVDATSAVVSQLKELGGAMLVLPCGFGKTVCSLWVAHTLRRRTLIVVHSEALADQWKERIDRFVPSAVVGRIQQNTVVVEGCDFVVCMIQSLAKRDYDAAVLGSFGLVILDEAHHVAAPMFSRALPKLPSRYILGLSATPDRNDGLGEALEWLMGPIAYRASRVFEHVDVRVLTYTRGEEKEVLNRQGNPMCSTMITDVSGDVTRNKWILSLITRYVTTEDRKIIVLGDRLNQLVAFEQELTETLPPNITVGRVVGGMSAAKRDAGFACTVLLSTYKYASEGIDIPRLDTLVMATPRATIEQTLGRILRPHPDKQTPLVLDIKDSFSLFEAMAWKRHNYYKKCHYNIFRGTDVDVE